MKKECLKCKWQYSCSDSYHEDTDKPGIICIKFEKDK